MTACAGNAQNSRAPATHADDASGSWSDAPLLGSDPASEQAQLEQWRESGQLTDALARLDRLLDLFDAARFTQNAELTRLVTRAVQDFEHTQTSDEADARTRATALALVGEAWRVEERHAEELSDDAAASARDFLADFITLTSIDAEMAAEDDDLRGRALAWRMLAKDGHPRVADNAGLRRYDHRRGLYELASQAGAGEAQVILAQAELLEDDEASFDQAQAALSKAQLPELANGLSKQLDKVASAAHWSGIQDARAPLDAALLDLVAAKLAHRDSSWKLPKLAASTTSAIGHDEGWPVVFVDTSGPRLFDDKAQAIEGEPAVAQAIKQQVLRDGRASLLIAAAPDATLKQLDALEKSLKDAEVAKLGLLVDQASGQRGVLPLRLEPPRLFAWAPEKTHTADALRVGLVLDAKFVRVRVDGVLGDRAYQLHELSALLDRLHKAYPRESVLGLEWAPHAPMSTLADVIAALKPATQNSSLGGFRIAARHQPKDRGRARGRIETALSRRAELADFASTHKVRIEQAYPLRSNDQRRLEQLASDLSACIPEYESDATPSEVEVRLTFLEGGLTKVESQAAPENFTNCVRTLGTPLRLREHRDQLSFTLRW